MYMQRNNGKLFVNYRIRENGKKINVFDKINLIKQDLKTLFPEVEEDRLLSMMSHIRNFHYNKLFYGKRTNPENFERKRELTEIERMILDYLLKNNLNPSTTYRWFLACRVPADIKSKLENNRLSVRKAMQIAVNRKLTRESNQGLLMMEEINNIVRSL